MNLLDLYLREHASTHTEAVAKADPFNIDYLLDGLTGKQLRLLPHGMNSLAWIFWHVARVEDGLLSCIVFGRDQLFDQDNWSQRLAVPTRDVSTHKEDVARLSDAIDLDALWAYRNAVGGRTREAVRDLWPDRWESPITVTDVRRAVSVGVCDEGMEQFLPGKSRESALNWWGLNHTLMHLGQVSLLRGVVKDLLP